MLIGKALSKQIPASTTGNQALALVQICQQALTDAGGTLDAVNAPSLASSTASASFFGGLWTSVDALFTGASDGGSVAAAGDYLTSTRGIVQSYAGNFAGDDLPISSDALDQLRTIVSTTSVCAYQIDNLFSTTWADDLSAAVVDAIEAIPATVAAAVSSVAGIVSKGLGSAIGGTWWLWLALGIGAYLYLRRKVHP
jgi:hypothetical protein